MIRTSLVFADLPKSPTNVAKDVATRNRVGTSQPRNHVGVPRREQRQQLDENLDALNNMVFSDEELKRIDEFAVESGIDLWRRPATE